MEGHGDEEEEKATAEEVDTLADIDRVQLSSAGARVMATL
ncbi:hypothetical protein TSOC_002033 [Tetrabaena socialis]|uniref:Uncharacterized protein n=1 Tax=Tetrabaena socialis TaxID=47790 RepID=A0A2J8AF62_9CHLO|nr:hypothetical protein TSOC_002033 [Tetrabaena socialis]|eukprot:PNH11157.1 hypothetical protein TSOC_002033 [Tetrabaena socialis]